MFKIRLIKKQMKGFVSLLLVLSVMAGLFVPFDISVSAAEEPAKPDEIHAIVYVIDPTKKNTDGSIKYDNNLELVLQKGGEEDPTRTVVDHFENFCDASARGKSPLWRASKFNKSGGPSNIYKIDVRDKIQPVVMDMWFESFRNIPSTNIQHFENIDTSECISMQQTFNYAYGLTKLDLSTWDVSKVKNMSCVFGRCWGLRDFNISTWTFESVTNMGMAFCGTEFDVLDLSNANFSKCTSMNRTFSIDGTYPTHKIKKIILPDNCTVANGCDLYRMFYRQSDLSEVNIEGLQTNNPMRMQEMFIDCKLLENIDLSGITGYSRSSDGKPVVFNGTFEGCKALKTVDLSGYTGPIAYTTNSPFTGCENLVSVDFAKINTASGAVTDLSGKANMFADNPELSWIRLSDNWPASDKIGNTIATKGTWKKLDDPDKGTEKSNEELFKNFRSGYKGTWGAMSVITFKGNGGTPSYQTVDGIKNDTITFGDELTATRVGYDFAGWWPDKTEEPEGTSALQSGDEAEQWNYYAHWTPHTYTLVLDGNGGTVPDGVAIDGATISQDRKTITYSNVSYPEFVELSSNMFGKTGNNTLSSWNTRANGTGTQYYVSDSVNQLTPTQGGTVTLFAQWDESDYVVTFDAQGGSSVSKKTYRRSQQYGTLPPSEKGGYTFLGWFTAAEGGTKITSDMSVTSDITLYAHWQENPKVYFDPCNGSAEIPFNVYNYGQKLGVVAAPEWGNRTFEGWYTAGECCYYTDGTKDGYGSFYVKPWDEVSASPTVKDTITVKLTNNQNWASVYVYAFDKDENATMGEWPGTAMTYIGNNDYNEGIYSIEVPANTAKVVFSNGSNAAQTVDVTLTPGKGGAPVENISNETATGNAYYYAHWSYRPEFDSDGGTFTSYNASNYPPQDSPDYLITVLPTATKAYATNKYYALDGWYWQYEEDGVQKEKKITVPETIDLSKGTVIKAKWTPTADILTVTFVDKDPADPDNAQKTRTTSVQVYQGEKIGQMPTPARDGYDFAGWFREVSSSAETVNSTFSADTTLYAQWSAKNISISFDPSGGALTNGSQSTVAVSSGGGIDVLPNAILENKVLAGWYLKDDSGNFVEASRLVSGRALPDTTDHGVTITDNKTYYAKWTDPETLEDNGFFKCAAEWSTQTDGGATNYGDTLVFRPTSKGTISAHLSMAFERVQNKQYAIPAGALKIKMPVSVFRDKDGNDVGTNNINGNDKFTRTTETIDGHPYYVYTNSKALNEDSGFEFHYTVDPTALAAKTGSDLFYKNDFKVYIEYNDTDHTVNFDRDLSLEVHTSVNTTVEKEQASVSLEWDSDWGAKPADADEYFYVIWNLSAECTNCTQKYRLCWSEDTVHDGTVFNSTNLNSWSEYLTGGKSTAQVVTKHRRSEVDSSSGWYTVKNEAILDVEMASGEQLHYRAAASAYAYIPTSGGTGGLTKHIKADYLSQENHVKGFAQEYILNGSTASLPALDYAVTYTEDENTDRSITWSDKTNSYTTAERTMLLSDGNAGDLRISPVKGSNKYKWGDSSIEQNLNSGDYSFTYLKIWLTEYDAVKMNNTWSNPYRHRAEDYGDMIVRVKTTANPNLEVVPITDGDGLNDYVEVTLPDGTYYYEIEHKTSFYTTDMRVETSVRLNITNRLQSIVSDHVYDGYRTLIKNKCNLDITRSGSTETFSSARANDAWPEAYELTKGSSTLYAFKKCAAKSEVTEDPLTSTEDFPVLLTSWNYNTGTNLKYMKSGEFNDLLPSECTVDKDSVFVWRRTTGPSVNVNSANDINNKIGVAVTKANYNSQKASADNLPAGNYSVILTPDWQGSGRTMLTVRMTVPDGKTATGFNVFYKMKTSYSNINRRGTNLTNDVSFTDTTYKQSKPNTRYGTLDLLDSDTKQYYTSIDDEYTAYAFAQTDCVVPSIYTYGLTSHVQAEGSDLTDHEVVGLNANYTYHINYNNNYLNDDLVLFDTIELRTDGTKSDWYGTMLGIDVSEIKKIASANSGEGYCDPVVYYTTKDRSLLSKDDFDLSSNIWTQTAPSDLSMVTAVAVDCRKTTTNNDFVLAKKQNLGFSINMRSPSNNVNSGEITYNEAVMQGKITDNNMAVYSHAYTDVTILFSEPEFKKTAFPSSGTQANPAEVVQNSVLAYYLTITNPDETMPMLDLVVEDTFINSLNFNNTITVKINDGAEIAIDDAARVSSYSIDLVDNEAKVKFTAAIDSLDPGETITIQIPVTVSSPITTVLTNKAKITSVNGVTYAHPIESDETCHKVTGTKAKILKTRSNGNALAGAELEIYENNATNFNAATGKIKSGAKALELRNDGVLVGEGTNHDYFTSTTAVKSFDIAPGKYVLHEKTLPTGYETAAADIPFRVDVEGIHYIKKNNKEVAVSYIEMVNTPPYQVIYHTNLPTGTDEVFLTVDSPDLVENKVTAFSEIPTFSGDKYYTFTGWYTQANGGDKVTFDRTYTQTTHLYAHWHAYKIIFHANNPNDANDDVFKTVDPSSGELNARNGITHFYDIPSFAGDKYVFAGWYHSESYLKDSELENTGESIDMSADFEKDTYLKKSADSKDPDYHLYAKWIEVGTVAKQTTGELKDLNNYGSDSLSGFGLAGIQIRPEKDENGEDMYDPNERDPGTGGEEYNNMTKKTPGGLRFVTSVSENLLTEVKGIQKIDGASSEAKRFGVEYGYVVGTEANMAQFIDGIDNSVTGNYKNVDLARYRLQYNGENVNGVDTTGKNRTAETDYRYIKNVNCTSRQKATAGCGVVTYDHRNFNDYRLYTLVVTYENDEASKSKMIDARAYMRYYDANGKLRVFYNDYKNSAGNTYYGGCMCSYDQVKDMT